MQHTRLYLFPGRILADVVWCGVDSTWDSMLSPAWVEDLSGGSFERGNRVYGPLNSTELAPSSRGSAAPNLAQPHWVARLVGAHLVRLGSTRDGTVVAWIVREIFRHCGPAQGYEGICRRTEASRFGLLL